MGRSALVLDFGGPVLRTPFELVRDQPDSPARRVLLGRGPFASAETPDTAWEDAQSGAASERGYWDERAREWHESGGDGEGVRAMLRSLYEPPCREFIRDQAWALVADARAAGIPSAILTNDLRAFYSDDWIERMGFLETVDVVVDGSTEGVLKPDPRLYQIAADRLSVPFEDMVFLDDRMVNIRGAEVLHIDAVPFDVTDPDRSYRVVREHLGLNVP